MSKFMYNAYIMDASLCFESAMHQYAMTKYDQIADKKGDFSLKELAEKYIQRKGDTQWKGDSACQYDPTPPLREHAHDFLSICTFNSTRKILEFLAKEHNDCFSQNEQQILTNEKTYYKLGYTRNTKGAHGKNRSDTGEEYGLATETDYRTFCTGACALLERLDPHSQTFQETIKDIQGLQKPGVWHNLPSIMLDGIDFIGHAKEVEVLLKNLEKESHKASYYGDGGSGKTTFLLHVLHQYVKAHKDDIPSQDSKRKVIVWCSFKKKHFSVSDSVNPSKDVENSLSTEDVRGLYARIINACKVGISDIDSEEALKERVKELAEQYEITLVLDNTDAIPQGGPMREGLKELIDSPLSKVLITSRFSDLLPNTKKLKPLSEDEAVELFRQAWDEDIASDEMPEDAAIHDIVKKDRNPLTIRRMVILAKNHSGNFQILAESLLEPESELIEYRFGNLLQDLEEIDRAVLFLAAENGGSRPKNQIQQIILLSRQEIALERMSDNGREAVDIGRLSQEVCDDVEEAISRLERRSLIETEGKDGSIAHTITVTPALLPIILEEYATTRNRRSLIQYDRFVQRFNEKNKELFTQLNLPEEELDITQQAQLAAADINWTQFSRYYYGDARVSDSGEWKGYKYQGILSCLRHARNALEGKEPPKAPAETAVNSLKMILNAYENLRDFLEASGERKKWHFKAYLTLVRMYSHLKTLFESDEMRGWEKVNVKPYDEVNTQKDKLCEAIAEKNWADRFLRDHCKSPNKDKEHENTEYGYAAYTFYAILEKRRVKELERQVNELKQRGKESESTDKDLKPWDLEFVPSGLNTPLGPEASLKDKLDRVNEMLHGAEDSLVDKLDNAIEMGEKKQVLKGLGFNPATQAIEMRFNYATRKSKRLEKPERRKPYFEERLKEIDEFIQSLPLNECKIRTMQDKLSMLTELIHLYKETEEEKAINCTSNDAVEYMKQAQAAAEEMVKEAEQLNPRDFFPLNFSLRSLVTASRVLLGDDPAMKQQNIDTLTWVIDQFKKHINPGDDKGQGEQAKAENAEADGDGKVEEDGEFHHATFLNFRFLPEAFLNRAKARGEKGDQRKDILCRMREDYERAYTARLRYPAKTGKDGKISEDDKRLNEAMDEFLKKLKTWYGGIPFETHKYVILRPQIKAKKEPAHGFILYDLGSKDPEKDTVRVHYNQLNPPLLATYLQFWDEGHPDIQDKVGSRMWYSKLNWSAARLMEHYLPQCDDPSKGTRTVFELYCFRSFKKDEDFYALSLDIEDRNTEAETKSVEELSPQCRKHIDPQKDGKIELPSYVSPEPKERGVRGSISRLPYIASRQFGLIKFGDTRPSQRAIFYAKPADPADPADPSGTVDGGLRPAWDLHYKDNVIFDLYTAKRTRDGETETFYLAKNIRLAPPEQKDTEPTPTPSAQPEPMSQPAPDTQRGTSGAPDQGAPRGTSGQGYPPRAASGQGSPRAASGQESPRATSGQGYPPRANRPATARQDLTLGAIGIAVKVVALSNGSMSCDIRCEDFGTPAYGAPDDVIAQLEAAQEAAGPSAGVVNYFCDASHASQCPPVGARVRFKIVMGRKGGYKAFNVTTD